MSQDNTVKMLHEFLQKADNNSPQIFLAHIAMLAAQDARRQIQPIHAQKLNVTQTNLYKALEQYQKLKEQYQQIVQEHESLKSKCTLLRINNQSCEHPREFGLDVVEPDSPPSLTSNVEQVDAQSAKHLNSIPAVEGSVGDFIRTMLPEQATELLSNNRIAEGFLHALQVRAALLEQAVYKSAAPVREETAKHAVNTQTAAKARKDKYVIQQPSSTTPALSKNREKHTTQSKWLDLEQQANQLILRQEQRDRRRKRK